MANTLKIKTAGIFLLVLCLAILYFLLPFAWDLGAKYFSYIFTASGPSIITTRQAGFFSFFVVLALVPFIVAVASRVITYPKKENELECFFMKAFIKVALIGLALSIVLSVIFNNWIENNGYQYCRALSNPSALPGTKSTYVLDMADCKAE